MQITITKGRSDDVLAIRRADGSTVETRFPKKGPVPHDVVHYFVERGLGLTRGFWGLVAKGRHPEDLAELAKAAGHASAKRAEVPGEEIVELLQAERIVECFEAELWSAGTDDAALLDLAVTACANSQVAMPAVPEGAISAIRSAIAAYAAEWIAAREGAAIALEWE